MLEDRSAKTTIEEGKKSTAVSGDVIPVETAKSKEEEENEKKSEKAKDEAERNVENAATTNSENGGDTSAAATDSCTSDVSDMRICDAAAAVFSAHPEAGESMPPSSDPDSDVITRKDCNPSNMSSEERVVITSSLSEQVTIDLTQETAESNDTIIDLTAEPTTADTGTGTATAGLIIDLTTDPPTTDESTVSKSSSESSAKSRRSKRAPLAVYVPPRGRGPPPGSGATTATKKTSAAESVLVPAPPPSVVATTEDAPGVDVTEQVTHGFPISCNSWP